MVNTAGTFVKTNESDRDNERSSMAEPGPPIAAIAAALRSERERSGMTLSEAARRAGIAKSTLSQLESGTGNPSVETLWALAVGIWGLVVGIMALRVHFERPAAAAEVDRKSDELKPRVTAMGAVTAVELREFARSRLERIGRLKFHVAAWVLGMIVLTPLWALIEWQDNGAFERFGNDSQPGEWEPWILYIGGVRAFVIAILALRTYFDRPTTEAEIARELERLDSRG